MKKIMMIALSSLVLCAGMQDPMASERKEVERAVLDYVEAFYKSDYSLIERSVHPKLSKVGFYRPNPGQEYSMMPMTFGAVVNASHNYNKDGHISEDAPKKVELLEVLDQTAAAKLSAEWGIDYLHLAKYNGKWKIIHVLWQSYPE